MIVPFSFWKTGAGGGGGPSYPPIGGLYACNADGSVTGPGLPADQRYYMGNFTWYNALAVPPINEASGPTTGFWYFLLQGTPGGGPFTPTVSIAPWFGTDHVGYVDQTVLSSTLVVDIWQYVVRVEIGHAAWSADQQEEWCAYYPPTMSFDTATTNRNFIVLSNSAPP